MLLRLIAAALEICYVDAVRLRFVVPPVFGGTRLGAAMRFC